MNVAFIPVRGGSKSIPLKNIKEICGKPLVYWALKAAQDCLDIDKIYVATDSERIKDVVNKLSFSKVEVIGRSEETATDTASTESALIEFAETHTFDTVALIQATSPLLSAEDLSRGFEVYHEKETDCVLSVVEHKRFHWVSDRDGYVKAVNYDYHNRPRRQEFSGDYVENGAFYITSREGVLQSGNRLNGKIRACIMPVESYLEIDEPSDWIVIEQLLTQRSLKQVVVPNWGKVRMVLSDCDGVLTDGGMYYSENGDELKKYNTRDGMGFRMLQEKGIVTGIITGEKGEINVRRAKKLNLDVLQQGVTDKASALRMICETYGIPVQSVVYIGDDLNDLDAIRLAGIGCCTSDGNPAVKKAADYVTHSIGGHGALREVADLVLMKRGSE